MGQSGPQQEPDRAFVERLVKATGISEAEARELISFLGYDWASLMREAASSAQSPREPYSASR